MVLRPLLDQRFVNRWKTLLVVVACFGVWGLDLADRFEACFFELFDPVCHRLFCLEGVVMRDWVLGLELGLDSLLGGDCVVSQRLFLQLEDLVKQLPGVLD